MARLSCKASRGRSYLFDIIAKKERASLIRSQPAREMPTVHTRHEIIKSVAKTHEIKHPGAVWGITIFSVRAAPTREQVK